MMFRIRSLVLALALVVAACASGPPPGPVETAAGDSELSYKLGAGDKLRITTFGESQLSGEFSIGDGGILAFPLLGPVPAADATVAELREKLETGLKDGYLKEPRVSVEVLTYRPYYVLGEVGKPGEYAYASGLTVMNAIAAASGFTYRANTKRVYIKRAGLGGEQAYPLSATLPVMPGDTIRVGERFF